MRNFTLLENSGDSVILQMDLDYDGDCTLEMEVGTSLGSIPLGIKVGHDDVPKGSLVRSQFIYSVQC